MNILITAPPKTGKSTVLKKLLSLLSFEETSGLLTEEIRENDVRIGFKTKIVNTKQEYIIAHTSLIDSNVKVGKYSVDPDVIFQSFKNALDTKKSIFFIDEIGRMQASSKIFLNETYNLLLNNSDSHIIATIVYDDEDFAKRFKELNNVKVIEVTLENRDQLPYKLLDIINN